MKVLPMVHMPSLFCRCPGGKHPKAKREAPSKGSDSQIILCHQWKDEMR